MNQTLLHFSRKNQFIVLFYLHLTYPIPDDDDFDTNVIIDRNLEVSFLGIDNLSDYIPPEEPDIWEDKDFAEAPYTARASEHKKSPYLGSAANFGNNKDAEFLPMESLTALVG